MTLKKIQVLKLLVRGKYLGTSETNDVLIDR